MPLREEATEAEIKTHTCILCEVRNGYGSKWKGKDKRKVNENKRSHV